MYGQCRSVVAARVRGLLAGRRHHRLRRRPRRPLRESDPRPRRRPPRNPAPTSTAISASPQTNFTRLVIGLKFILLLLFEADWWLVYRLRYYKRCPTVR